MPLRYAGNQEQIVCHWKSIIKFMERVRETNEKIYISPPGRESGVLERIHERRKLRERGKRFQVLPSPPDSRDYGLCHLNAKTYKYKKLPSKKINSPPPWILDQGDTPFCVGATGANCKNAHYNNYNILPIDGFSMTFLYWVCKMYDGSPEEEGTFLRTANKVLQKYGICEERLAPFQKMIEQPIITSKMTENAQNYKIDGYAKLDRLTDIKSAIMNGFYVPIATIITSKNWSTSDGFLSWPHGYLLGAHATFIYGFDDDLKHGNHKGYFYGINSWGDSWGDSGRFYLPYDYYYWFDENSLPFPAFLEAWALKMKDTPDAEEENNFNDGNKCIEDLNDDIEPAETDLY